MDLEAAAGMGLLKALSPKKFVEKKVEKVLLATLGQFCDLELDGVNLDLSTLTVKLEGLEIKPGVFHDMGLPISLNHGYLGSVTAWVATAQCSCVFVCFAWVGMLRACARVKVVVAEEFQQKPGCRTPQPNPPGGARALCARACACSARATPRR